MIVLTGTSIGANDFIEYKTGEASLHSRSEYCQFISKNNKPENEGTNSWQTLSEMESLDSDGDLIAFSKIWNLKKILAAYRAKRIEFTWLPKGVHKEIVKKQLHWSAELREVNSNIQSVSLKMNDLPQQSVLNREPGSFAKWQRENEWPLQLKILNERKRWIENKLSNLQIRSFTDAEILELITRVEEPMEHSLIIEARMENRLINSRLSFYPVWVRGTERTPASDSSWFEVHQRFLPKSSLTAIQNRQLPPGLNSYLKVAARASGQNGENDSETLKYINDSSMLVYGTPKSAFLSEDQRLTFTSPNDLAIEGLLDLACLYQ